MTVLRSVRDRADRWQQRHASLGFPIAVVRKHGDDAGGRHAALMTYYGFLSLFPIMLLAVVIVSRVLTNFPSVRAQVVKALVPFQFRGTLDYALASLPDGGIALWAGLIALVGTSVGVVLTAHDTLNQVAGVPHRLRASGLSKYLRVLAALVVLLVGIIALAAVTVQAVRLSAPDGLDTRATAVETAAAILILFAMVWLGAMLLLPRRPRLRSTWPMALGGAVAITVLLAFGALLLPALVMRAGPIYGAFAAIVGLFSFISLIAQALVWTAEVASVRHHRLWPRSLDAANPIEADAKALRMLAREQERIPSQRITSEVG